MEGRPIFGIVTTSVAGRRDAEGKALDYKPRPIWWEIERRAHELGLLACFFHPEDADFARGRVHGWVCVRCGEGEAERWKRRFLPLPDVVFDNVYVHLSGTREVKRMRRRFQERGIPLFNPTLGSKEKLADWLRSYRRLWKHHPDTVLLRDPQDVLEFLQRYPSAYLKPVNGSAGAGILEVREVDDGYLVRAAKFGVKQQPLEKKMNFGLLPAFLRRQSKRERFILQAGCELLHVDDGKIDLRTHLQRDLNGDWVCVALVVKQGRKHSIVSNYHAGGATHDWSWLQERAEEQGFPLPEEQRVTALSQSIAQAYADKEPELSSIGLDLGIDVEGRLWLLDVNSRPGRNILNQEQKEHCQRLNAEFAAYLLARKRGGR